LILSIAKFFPQRHIRLLYEKRNIGPNEDIPEEYYDCFTELWKDDTIQITMLKGHQWALHDNLF
jgi:guanine nucleotide-binding protein subunit alpha